MLLLLQGVEPPSLASLLRPTPTLFWGKGLVLQMEGKLVGLLQPMSISNNLALGHWLWQGHQRRPTRVPWHRLLRPYPWHSLSRHSKSNQCFCT